MGEKALTAEKLSEITKETVSNYMKAIEKRGDISHEKALLGLILQIAMVMETQRGKAEARQFFRSVVGNICSTNSN